MQDSYDLDKRKLLIGLSHGSIFFSALLLSAGIPLAIWFVSSDPIVKESAQEALNFHFNVWLYGLIFWLLTFVLIGYPLLAILFVVQIVLPILAIIKALRAPETVYRYPFIFRIL
ncbi:DUF4870 domain-containing protein [Almyronema epifaneia]|uniref:DUF4870 domain-containing protein n=1 Tax=Almyronema epifaneia S1 TaxID=2991925 RepID=A0ABW6IGQ6_9CYAN